MIGLRLLVAAALATVGAGAAVAAPLKVVATFSVLGDMVSTIAGDRVDLVTIVGGDGDTELYQATPADARTLADADLLVENDINPEFEPWLEGLVKRSGFKGSFPNVSRKCPPRGLLKASVSVIAVRRRARTREAIACGS